MKLNVVKVALALRGNKMKLEITEGPNHSYSKITISPQANGSTILSIFEQGNMFPSRINLSPNACKTLGEWLIERAKEINKE